MSHRMNPWQRAVCETYAEGDFRHVPDEPDWRAALDDCGDTLFRFLMIELADSEDCDSAETALQRLERARADIEQAISDVTGLIAVH
jgi:hypothetical protein